MLGATGGSMDRVSDLRPGERGKAVDPSDLRVGAFVGFEGVRVLEVMKSRGERCGW